MEENHSRRDLEKEEYRHQCSTSGRICRARFEFVRRNGATRALADLRGGARDALSPGGPNSFIFMQFLAKI